MCHARRRNARTRSGPAPIAAPEETQAEQTIENAGPLSVPSEFERAVKAPGGGERTCSNTALPIAGDEYVQGYRDGAPRTAEFGIVTAHAVGPGRFALSDSINNNIRLFEADLVSTLSGPRPDFRTVDGTAVQARISLGNFIYSVATGSDDTIEFIDGFALRKIDAPKAIAYERTGTLVVVVEGALLRLHPLTLHDLRHVTYPQRAGPLDPRHQTASMKRGFDER